MESVLNVFIVFDKIIKKYKFQCKKNKYIIVMFLSAGTQPATLILIGWLFELWLATANHGYAKNKNVYKI